MSYRLLDASGRTYASAVRGAWGGHRRSRIYGRLDCPSALRAIARGGYAAQRVFFADERTAVAAGFRPCAVCCPDRYAAWKAGARPPDGHDERRWTVVARPPEADGGPTLFPPDRRPVTLAPGAHLVRGWLDLRQQEWIVRRFREWTAGPVPIRAATVRGHPMSVRTVCLGWHWQPYRYTRVATDVNGARVLPFPDWLVRAGRRALADTGHDAGEVARYTPDTALVNFYDAAARMGMHQDKDEVSRAPVVSLSIGDTCTFRLGNTENRNRPYTDVTLESGDLVVFGGPSRLAFHGVTAVHAGTAPPGCGLDAGRINLTLRETGLTD